MVQIEYTLVAADWCPYCKKFYPEWDKFKTIVDKHNGNINGATIKYVTVKDNEIKCDEPNGLCPKINGQPTRGYPTIKLSIDGKEEKYSGERDAIAMINYALSKVDIGEYKHTGGRKKDNSKDYKKKALKYEIKYLQSRLSKK